jgi:diguanylate cyclase
MRRQHPGFPERAPVHIAGGLNGPIDADSWTTSLPGRKPRQAFAMWIDKIRRDFDLAIVVMFGIITNLVILPFAAYRFLNGQMLAGVIDLLIVTCISLGALRVYSRGKIEHVALILAMTYSLGCIAIAYVAGPGGSLWMYAVLLSTFLLVERNRAVLISAIGIAAVAASPLALPEAGQKATFVGSTIVVSLFSYVFAWRTDLQRRQLENLASLDPLTGAGNRRGMHTEIENAIATSARNGKPLGLIIFDLDHFKRINDLFGHEAGDDVLVQVADAVRRSTRRNDRFFRHGGEEFALLIPDSDPNALREITEKVRLAVQHDVHCGDIDVSISLGASIMRRGESASEWQARADSAMYRAKRDGRNRSVVDELEPESRQQTIHLA